MNSPTPVHYPVEDDVGETLLHLLIRTLLLDLVRRWLAVRGTPGLVGSEQFIYWVEGNPHRCVAPDLYVLFGVDPNLLPRSWKIWEEHVVPRFAMEVVSDDAHKDYVLGPMRYAEIGVDELIIYDPEPETSRDGVRWQVYRRRDGELLLEARSDGDRVASEVLGCHLRLVDHGGHPLVRLGKGPNGDDLVPTADEEIAELRRRLAAHGE